MGGEQIGQLAIIARCNFTLFAEAVKTCCYSDKKVKVAFVGVSIHVIYAMFSDKYGPKVMCNAPPLILFAF